MWRLSNCDGRQLCVYNDSHSWAGVPWKSSCLCYVNVRTVQCAVHSPASHSHVHAKTCAHVTCPCLQWFTASSSPNPCRFPYTERKDTDTDVKHLTQNQPEQHVIDSQIHSTVIVLWLGTTLTTTLTSVPPPITTVCMHTILIKYCEFYLHIVIMYTVLISIIERSSSVNIK